MARVGHRTEGERIEGEGEGPIGALNALARELRPLRGSASGGDW
jgi:hypothetical protein